MRECNSLLVCLPLCIPFLLTYLLTYLLAYGKGNVLCHTYLLTILTIWDSFLLPLKINISGPIMHYAYSIYAYFDVSNPHVRNQLKETDRAQVHMWINISGPKATGRIKKEVKGEINSFGRIMPYLLTYLPYLPYGTVLPATGQPYAHLNMAYMHSSM